MGVQVYPAGGGRRQDGAGGVDAAHDGEQDLSAGDQRSEGAGGRVSGAGRRICFSTQGIIIGSVEAGYFTPSQQELIREFVDQRGGGVLFLGGRFSLSDGGWAGSSVTELLPTFSAGGKRDVSSRSGYGGVDGGWCG